MSRRCLDCATRAQATQDGLCDRCQSRRWEAYFEWKAARDDDTPRSGQSTLGGFV